MRIGHVLTPSGEKQYRLCGQFLPAQEAGKAEWTPFATIKTSNYEQCVGAQAAGFCQDSSVIWDNVDDLSPSLLSRLDSLRLAIGRCFQDMGTNSSFKLTPLRGEA